MGGTFPAPHRQLLEVMDTLEKHYRDMCDIEFTIEQGRLFILQTRVGKRTAAAALRMAVEMEGDGLIDRKEAVLRVQPAQLDQLLHPQFDPAAKYEPLAKGLNASPGAAVGKVYFTADDAETRHEAGERVILVRPETSPDDLHGMIAAEGILTSRGGLVSHAAVVARGMGTPAVCGASALEIDVDARAFAVDGTLVREGDVISINGTTGEVVVGEVPVITPEPSGPFETILGWADEFRTLGVRTNADLPEDSAKARRFGAEGIGLCRTEHMFLGDRLPIVQRFILATEEKVELAALDELEALQKSDFVGIFEAMDGLPVTIRLLDPPLHEFLPDIEELLVRDAKGELDGKGRSLLAAAQTWRESNPMLGTRGCRLGIIKPGLYRMQVKAILEAAIERKVAGGDPQVEIMIPLAVARAELAFLVDETLEVEGVGQLVREAVEKGRAVRPDLKLGICGEHGGDPASVRFCHEVGLDYVSCSPYRVPLARLAAAHAALGAGGPGASA
jgi:pyruvate,orthophosphate dikinase